MQAITFTNFSTEDFTWKFDGIPYTFKAGQTIMLEDFKAHHFAKHLVDRELTREGVSTGNVTKRQEMELLCLTTPEVVTPVEMAEKTQEVKKKDKAVEVEFEDLSATKK